MHVQELSINLTQVQVLFTRVKYMKTSSNTVCLFYSEIQLTERKHKRTGKGKRSLRQALFLHIIGSISFVFPVILLCMRLLSNNGRKMWTESSFKSSQLYFIITIL